MASAFLELLERGRSRLRPPVLIVGGAPRLVADLVASLGLNGTACFQFDLFQAERLRNELRDVGTDADDLTSADLWNVPARFGSVLIPSPPRGERELKRDLVEQSYHVLADDGRLVVLSPVGKDQLYPALLKKIYGKVALETSPAGTVLWSSRHGDRPRRRHEVSYHVRDGESSVVILSRPGVFSYGELDNGARALAEAMRVEPGERVLDLGCGVGAVGIVAGRHGGHVSFVDSHLRAVALAELNARANGLANFECVAAAHLEGFLASSFDVVLANPPYYAQHAVARLFVDGAKRLLKPGGRLYLVTRQADIVGEIVSEAFGEPELELRRGYVVFVATR